MYDPVSDNHPDYRTVEQRTKAHLAWYARAFGFRRSPNNPKPKKIKTISALRTISDRKWVGMRCNKPKHGWSKKRRRQGGWKV